MTANELDELLRENPSFIISLQNKCEMQEKEIAQLKDVLGIQTSSADLNIKAVNKIKKQEQKIAELEKEIRFLKAENEKLKLENEEMRSHILYSEHMPQISDYL